MPVFFALEEARHRNVVLYLRSVALFRQMVIGTLLRPLVAVSVVSFLKTLALREKKPIAAKKLRLV